MRRLILSEVAAVGGGLSGRLSSAGSVLMGALMSCGDGTVIVLCGDTVGLEACDDAAEVEKG